MFEELIELVRTLQGRIQMHQGQLVRNELATRYALIDPLLRGLGWDTSDPGQVSAEIPATGGRADYALLGEDGRPRIIVEAKSLGRPTSEAISQTLTYCLEKGVEFFVVTNGDHWQVYETYRRAPIEEKLIAEFNTLQATKSTVMKMLFLWRGNFGADGPLLPPTFGLDAHKKVDTSSDSAFISFSDFFPKPNQGPPSKLRFPDKSVVEINSWRQIQIAVVEWLVDNRRLELSTCPLKSSRGRYLVATQPYKHSGARFRSPKQIGDLWIDQHFSARSLVRNSKQILSACGVDPASVRVLRPIQ